MKVTNGIYTRASSGYPLLASEAPSMHSGSVVVFYQEVDHFSMEVLRLQSMNIIVFQLASGV